MKISFIPVYILAAAALTASLFFCRPSFAQEEKKETPVRIEFSLDVSGQTSPRPKIFAPSIDLSGRGGGFDPSRPQSAAGDEPFRRWSEEIGFPGYYRLQFDLWETAQLKDNSEALEKQTAYYRGIIDKICSSGGTVIMTFFGTPAGMGKVLDKRSQLLDPQEFRKLVKKYIREFRNDKVWFEVWSAPDLDDFFLGSTQDYLLLYRSVAEAVKEVENEDKVQIYLGGPGTSWWYQNPEGNTVAAPEKSLIYELIRYCSRYGLPLDFITWHAYSTDPFAEQYNTAYNKLPVELIREWLSYFNLSKDTPLIIDEWNYDNGLNLPQERSERGNIAASYIPARLKGMQSCGVDGQIYYCMEDFHSNKKHVTRNIGAFWFDSRGKGGPKAAYSVFRMLQSLGDNFYQLSPPSAGKGDVGMLAGRDGQRVNVLVYNYVNPEAARDMLSRSVGSLNAAERKILLRMIKDGTYGRLLSRQTDAQSLWGVTKRLRSLLADAVARNDEIEKKKSSVQPLRITLKNIKGDYLTRKYVVDFSCVKDCVFSPAQERTVSCSGTLEETAELPAYSVMLFSFEPKPAEPPAAPAAEQDGQPKPAESPVTPETQPVQERKNVP